jgi:hypothetical protein
MALHLDVVCEETMTAQDRQKQTIRVIGEILPFVLAKYGVGSQSAQRFNAPQGPRNNSSRFQIDG